MIFVTGGSGMLGSYVLLELLNNGQTVRASKRPQSSLNICHQVFKTFSTLGNDLFSQIEWVDVDLFNQEDIEEHLSDISEVYHCAAQITNSRNDKFQLIENNSQITQNLVDAALNKNISKFCYVSSIAALGNTIDGTLISEKIMWKEQSTNSTYSISKYLSEMIVWRGIAEGLNAVIVNPSVILGIGDWNKGSANLFKKVDEGLKYYTKGSSGFVAAQDVAKIMYLLMNCEDCFKQNYIISSENLNFKELFDKISMALNVKAPYIYATPFLTQLAWRLEWLKGKIFRKDVLITKESARTAHKILKYDTSKLLEQLDFKYTNIDKTISEIARIYKTSL